MLLLSVIRAALTIGQTLTVSAVVSTAQSSALHPQCRGTTHTHNLFTPGGRAERATNAVWHYTAYATSRPY